MDDTTSTFSNSQENSDGNTVRIPCPYSPSRTFKNERTLNLHLRKKHCPELPSTSTHESSESRVLHLTPLETAFGAPLISTADYPDSHWHQRWKDICRLRGKQYDLPNGNVPRQFVYTLAEEIEALVKNDFPSERVLVFIAVMLQRDKMVKQAKDIRRLLTRRLQLWQANEYDILIKEALCSDKQFKSKNTSNQTDHSIKVFSRLMLRGKVREAVNWLNNNGTKSILNPGDEVDSSGKTVLDVLKAKHPEPHQPNDAQFELPESMNELPSLHQVDITNGVVERVARKIHGGGGPGGSNAEQWTDFLLRYGQASSRLRDAVASLCLKLNNQTVPWYQISALMANRLIALDKCPGVRPIGVGECLRRILSKCMIETTGDDVTEACGKSQLCSGLKGGIEGAVHAMSELFSDRSSPHSKWGLLLVDANNAFNAINRQLALWQARIYWPRCARFLYNTYRGKSNLVLRDTMECLYSKEGVIQGDPLAMPLYALATLPLINSLKHHENITQCWYADDASAQGTLENLKKWWSDLNIQGSSFGYFPQGEKSVLVVSEEDKDDANAIFMNTGVKVVTGQRFLGGFIGSESEKNKYAKMKVDEWISTVQKLTIAGKEKPHEAFTALNKSIQFQWTYFQRVLGGIDDYFMPLHEIIKSQFIPTLFDGPITNDEADMFTLPVNKGGLAIQNPSTHAKLNHETSKKCSKILSNSIINNNEFNLQDHLNTMKETKNKAKKKKEEKDDELLSMTIQKFHQQKTRAIERSVVKITRSKTSSWLSVLPIQKDHFNLSPGEFRDALAIRYHRQPPKMPASCDGCGERRFTLEHALCCKTGGLVTRRHNEMRDLMGELCEKAWGNAIKEPIITEQGEGLRGDIAVRGVWEAQREALFDIRVVDTDAPSHVSRPVHAVLRSAEEEKKRKYVAACEERHATFTPLVSSVDEVLAPQFQSFVNILTEKLSERWGKSFSMLLGWTRARIAISAQRAASMCIRGSRKKWKTGDSLLGYEDGIDRWK